MQGNTSMRAMHRVLGTTLLNRRLWHLNRHSVAWGVASGVFWAWIMLPVQTIGAVATSIFTRGNVPLAMASTWISNPLTMVPCFFLTYYVGLKVTGTEPIHGLEAQLRAAMDAGLLEGTRMTAKLLFEQLPHLYPVYIGGVVVGAVTALISYVVVKVIWRWSLIRRWNRRHDERRRINPALKITSCLAHLYRKARHAA